MSRSSLRGAREGSSRLPVSLNSIVHLMANSRGYSARAMLSCLGPSERAFLHGTTIEAMACGGAVVVRDCPGTGSGAIKDV